MVTREVLCIHPAKMFRCSGPNATREHELGSQIFPFHVIEVPSVADSDSVQDRKSSTDRFCYKESKTICTVYQIEQAILSAHDLPSSATQPACILRTTNPPQTLTQSKMIPAPASAAQAT